METHRLKRYFWNVLGVVGMVFFWAGIWDGIGYLGFLANPLASLLTGTLILLASSLVFKKISWKRTGKSLLSLVHKVHKHPQKHEFHVKYYDKIKKKHLLFQADEIKKIEKSFLILKKKQKEFFIPMHRVVEILHKGKSWKGKK